MTKLALDPMCVLSAWEEMGGNAFSSDDVHLEDPEAFTLDLSSWEARLKPLVAPASSQIQDNTNIFASLFNPTGMCFGFLPGYGAAVPTAGFFAPPAATDGAQVVPMCPSNSADTTNTSNPASDGAWGAATDCCAATDDAAQGSQLDEDVNMSIHFSDVEPITSSASPASSSEAGVVPDFDGGGGSPRKGGSSTATSSGSLPRAPASAAAEGPQATAATSVGMLQLPLLPSHLGAAGSACAAAGPAPMLPSSLFVPVCSQPHTGPAAVGCGGAVAIKQEPESYPCGEAAQPPPQPPPSPSPPSLMNTAASVPATRQSAISAQPPPQSQQQQQPFPPSSRAHAGGSAAAGVAAQLQQQQQAGAAAHVRTRAECLERYRQKKARRLYTKKIRYQLRKINADKRPRIKGRFVKKEELAEFLASQRGGAAAREEVEDPYFGIESDDE